MSQILQRDLTAIAEQEKATADQNANTATELKTSVEDFAKTIEYVETAFKHFQADIKPTPRDTQRDIEIAGEDTGAIGVLRALRSIKPLPHAETEFRFQEFGDEVKSLAEKTADAKKILVPSVTDFAKETEALGNITSDFTNATMGLPDDVNKLKALNQGFTDTAQRTREFLERFHIGLSN